MAALPECASNAKLTEAGIELLVLTHVAIQAMRCPLPKCEMLKILSGASLCADGFIEGCTRPQMSVDFARLWNEPWTVRVSPFVFRSSDPFGPRSRWEVVV